MSAANYLAEAVVDSAPVGCLALMNNCTRRLMDSASASGSPGLYSITEKSPYGYSYIFGIDGYIVYGA